MKYGFIIVIAIVYMAAIHLYHHIYTPQSILRIEH